MRVGRRSSLRAPLFWVVALCLTVGCGDGSEEGGSRSDDRPATTSSRPVPDPETAIRAAASFLRGSVAASDDPLTVADAAVNLDYLHRRFGDAAGLAWVPGELTPRAVAFAADPAGGTASAQLPVFVRMIDPDATLASPPTGPGMEGGVGVTAQALWCDVHPLPADFGASVSTAIGAGGYELTHAAAGLVLAAELGCALPPGLDGAAERAVVGLEDLLGDPVDLSLEACGILGYLGRPDLIPPRFVDDVVAAQGPDGGWPQESGGDSTVHATEWGLRCLLEAGSGERTAREPWAVGGSTLEGGP